MQKSSILLVLLIILAHFFSSVDGNAAGAPTSACSNMKPQPTHSAGGEQPSTLPYLITTNKLTYSAGEAIQGIFFKCPDFFFRKLDIRKEYTDHSQDNLEEKVKWIHRRAKSCIANSNCATLRLTS